MRLELPPPGLRARRERRRAKALIVKDKTVTSKARGESAAAKVKSAYRRKARKDLASDVEMDDTTVATKTRSGRRSSTETAQDLLMGRHKAVNISSTARLTVSGYVDGSGPHSLDPVIKLTRCRVCSAEAGHQGRPVWQRRGICQDSNAHTM